MEKRPIHQIIQKFLLGLEFAGIYTNLKFNKIAECDNTRQNILANHSGKFLKSSCLLIVFSAFLIGAGTLKAEDYKISTLIKDPVPAVCLPIFPGGLNDHRDKPGIVDAGSFTIYSNPLQTVMNGIIYVDQSNISGIETGESWSTAFTNLQDAIDYHNSILGPINEIWVAQGSYSPDQGQSYILNDRNAAFVFPDGVMILGGFPSGGGNLEARDWEACPTRLTGEIGGPSVDDNSAHVIVTQNVSNNTILDGFFVENGTATVITPTGQNGGAWLNVVDGAGNSSSPQIRNCVFQNNRSITFGGAIFNNAINGGIAEMSFTNCRFLSNQTTSTINGFGGAVYNGNTTNGIANMELKNCYFEGNSGNIGGTIRSIGRDGGTGAISLTVINSVFYQNTATTSLPGISCFNLNATSNINNIINSTFYGNTTTGAGTSGGGGIRMDNVSAGSQIINCILWANTANESPNTNQVRIQGGTVSIRNNIIQDYISTVNGNLNTNPGFLNEMNGDFRLIPGSPAINTGDNIAYQDATGNDPANDTDLNGNARLVESVIDRGAYEYFVPCPPANIVYVNASATGANNGSSWTDAYTDLQIALENECPGITEIWVAAGTYYPSQNISNTSTGPLDRFNTFSLRNELGIYGGFNGTESDINQRDWNTNITILSGDLDQNDGPGPFDNNDGNSVAVVTGINTDNTAILDGFTIEGGNANINTASSAPENSDRTGGGMYNYQAAPIIMNCNFKNNYALYGGGMFNHSSDPFISNCIFSGNSAVIGGGINSATSSPTIINCVIEGNYAADEGGGMSISSTSSPKIINCTISGNEATDNGGAAVIINSTTPEFINCVIWNNSANGSTTSERATFKTNFTVTVTYSNSIIANSGGSANWQFDQFNIDGGNNLDLDPIFIDQPVPSLGVTGNYRLQACSPAINKGNNDALAGGITTDIDNNVRIFGNIVDMGAYEYLDSPALPASVNCSGNVTNQNTDPDLCSYTVQGTEFDPEVESECPIAGIENDFNNESSLEGAIFQKGDTDVIWTVTDERGNTSSCSITITIEDNENPEAMCASSLNIQLNESGEANITAEEINAESTDNCEINSLSINQENFDCSHLGANVVTLTVIDEIGNSSQCTSVVTVEETIPPIALCSGPFTIQIDENGGAAITPELVDNGSTDNCDIGSLSVNQQNFHCSDIGENTVTLIVTDLNNNSSQCTTVITVEDNLAPVPQCAAPFTIQLDENGEAGISIDDINDESSDNCGIGNLNISPENFDCSNLGENIITLTITDVSGNSSQCTSIVTVEENIVPLAQCVTPFSIQLDENGSASITADDINAGSTDNCEISTLTINQGIFDCSHIGTNNITLTVTDAGNNSSQCFTVVTVEDNLPPIASCSVPFTIQLDENGEAAITPDDVNNGSYDNCEIGTLSINQQNFDCSNIGQNFIILTITDLNNNSSQCSSTITVQDTIPPTAFCYDQTIEFNGESTIQLNENELVNPEDNCGVQSIILSPPIVNTSQLGQTIPVISTVMDVNGNSSMCTSLITVTGLPAGWSQSPNGIGCADGNDFAYNAATEIWTATSTNCYYSSPFTSDAAAFAQRTLCGNGSITVEVTNINGTALGWAGVIMRESNDPGAKKAQLTTNMAGNQSRREFRVMTNGMAIPQNFPAQGRFWLRVVRLGNQFIMYNSPNGIQWFMIGAQIINMNSCIQIGLITTNYNSNSIVTATFANVSFTGNSSSQQQVSNENSGFSYQSKDFDAYPNPSSGELNLNLNEYIGKKVQIELYSLEGKLMNFIQMDEVIQSSQTIALDRYPGGMYFVKVKTEGLPEVTKRIILQN